jgi:drug/metabolite transporter (DMT)-like permease
MMSSAFPPLACLWSRDLRTLYWGMRYVNSGTAGVLKMSLTPLALLGFGIALGQERWSWINAIAMALGIAGLCVLFAPSVKANEGAGGLVHCRLLRRRLGGGILRLGLCARAAGDRALRQRHASGATMLIGGAALLLGSLGWEPHSTQSLEAFWGWPATLGWLFLLLFGSLIGYSIYMQLLRDRGPAKAGSFAFVSPIICRTRGRHCCWRNCLCPERCWHGRHAHCRWHQLIWQ